MTDENVQALADMLKQLEPGYLPYPVFEQIARLVALPVVEFIPLRMTTEGKVEVLLIERAADDPFWPKMLHTPGTVVRATDVHKGQQDDWQAFERIVQDELRGLKVSSPHYVGTMFHDSKRGSELAQLYWVDVLAEPEVGRFYDVSALPEQLIDSQRTFINHTSSDFRVHKGA